MEYDTAARRRATAWRCGWRRGGDGGGGVCRPSGACRTHRLSVEGRAAAVPARARRCTGGFSAGSIAAAGKRSGAGCCSTMTATSGSRGGASQVQTAVSTEVDVTGKRTYRLPASSDRTVALELQDEPLGAWATSAATVGSGCDVRELEVRPHPRRCSGIVMELLPTLRR